MLDGVSQHAGDLPEVNEEALGELELVGWGSHGLIAFPFTPRTTGVVVYKGDKVLYDVLS